MTASTNFGAAASDYATHRAGFPDSLFERLAALGVGNNGERVADVGAGTGTLGRGFARRGCRVTAIDPDARMLEQGRLLNAEAGVNIDDRVGAAEALPFDDNALDIVAAGPVSYTHLDVYKRQERIWYCRRTRMDARRQLRLPQQGRRQGHKLSLIHI